MHSIYATHITMFKPSPHKGRSHTPGWDNKSIVPYNLFLLRDISNTNDSKPVPMPEQSEERQSVQLHSAYEWQLIEEELGHSTLFLNYMLSYMTVNPSVIVQVTQFFWSDAHLDTNYLNAYSTKKTFQSFIAVAHCILTANYFIDPLRQDE